jgi:hypothetical protein
MCLPTRLGVGVKKRALRKLFGISMPFCLITCRLLALAAMGRPRGALRAQSGCRARASAAQGPLLGARFVLRRMCLPGKHI